MMDCERFAKVQVLALLGEASRLDGRNAASHAQICEDCRRAARRDRWLGAALAVDSEIGEAGFPGAHRRLLGAFQDRRAFCCKVEGPFGPVYLARTPRGLCRVSFRRSEEDFLNELEQKALLPEVAPAKLAREVRELEDYFTGRSRRFHIPVDLEMATPFERRVLEATAGIPFGEVASYSDIARRIGRPEARRAVGNALGRNPVAIVVPCHRVIAADGSIGGYTGGLAIKRKLLDIEGVTLREG